jgi:hypothetical protein
LNRKALLGILVTQILFTGLLGMFNTSTLAETIPITEVFYGDGHQVFEQGIYVIATETDPVEMYPDYTNKNAYYEMLKEHVTTETSVGVFISILVSQGICPSSGYGVGIESIERIANEFGISANFTEPGPSCIVFFWITNPVALIPIGSLPVGEYSITLQVDHYVHHCPSWWHEYIGTETWTATFNCSEWITVTSSAVEMSIENKTTPLGEELSMLMVAPIGAFLLPTNQVFDIYLYDSNYSLFSYWSQDKVFLFMMISVPPGHNETLRWNLYHYNPSTGEYTPPPPGDYYLVGAIMGWEGVTPPILIKIDNSTIKPIGSLPILLTATVDIDPNTLDLKSDYEWVTCYIELPLIYDVWDIDVSSILLNDTIPVDDGVPAEIGDYDSDGIPDLMVQFNRTELTAHIYHVSGIIYGNVTLTITGQLADETMFEGSDTIEVMFGGDADLSGYVETVDFFRWRENFGKTPDQCPPNVYPDFDDNGLVAMNDFFIWRENFGATVPSPP